MIAFTDRQHTVDLDAPYIVRKIAAALAAEGGIPYLIGGGVRDAILGHEVKDWDIEVYGLDADALAGVLSSFGEVNAVGRSFGVLKLKAEGEEFDFSLPRRENKVGQGHKGFQVELDPDLTECEAAARRDFTFNSMMVNLVTGELLDFFGGHFDLSYRNLRHTSPAFAEDPLRVLRGMQFAGRLELDLFDDELLEMAAELKGEYSDLAQERVWAEWYKWAAKSIKPSYGLKFLQASTWVGLYPELASVVGCPQHPEFHPEGWSVKFLPFQPSIASTTEPYRIDWGATPSAFRQAILGSQAESAMVPGFHGTPGTEISMDDTIDSLPTTQLTWPLDIPFTPEGGVTIDTPAQSFMWTFGTPTIGTYKTNRVMLQVPLSGMKSIVYAARNDLEIFKGIVHSIAIYVVDVLPRFKNPSKFDFHEVPVKANGSTLSTDFFGESDVLICSIVVNFESVPIDGDVLLDLNLATKTDLDFRHATLQHPEDLECHDTKDSLFCQVTMGDVWEHTSQVADEAALIAIREGLPAEDRAILVLAALVHDLGKAWTTFFNLEKGRYVAYGHEGELEPAEKFLTRIGCPAWIARKVLALAAEHMAPTKKYGKPGVRKLSYRLGKADLTVQDLALIVEADHNGRGSFPRRPSKEMQEILDTAREMELEAQAPRPLLMGRHLLSTGMSPGPEMGKMLKAAFEAQLDGEFGDLDGAVRWAEERMVA